MTLRLRALPVRPEDKGGPRYVVTDQPGASRVRRMESKRDAPSMDWRLIGVLVGVIGLGRAALGLHKYPYGDDMVYGPLARLAADPTLYPGDEQLRSFENHAWLYGLIWRAAEATIGVVPAHLALTLGLTLLTGLVMLWIARAVGAVGWLVPLGFLLANVVELRGAGRGAYGGAFGDHFHLQSLAIVLSLLALLAVLRARWILAGAALGLAALAQPVLAFHAAFAVGCFCLGRGWDGLRPLVLTALTSMIVAAPALLQLLDLKFGGVTDPAKVIQEGFIWRVDNHYRLSSAAYLLIVLYTVLGLFAALRLKQGAGAVVGLAVFGVLCWVFYAPKLGLNEVSTLPYMLDFSRSSPILWVFAAALAAAAAEKAWRDGDRVGVAVIAALSALIFALNGVWSLFSILALLGALIPITPVMSIRTAPGGLAGLGVAAVMLTIVALPDPLSRDAKMRGFYEWARTETAKDASFIAPPFIADIREFARRPVWVDFRAVSMAQPDQIMLSRERHEVITPGFEDLPDLGGWRGAWFWTKAYSENHDAASIVAALRRTGATYLVIYRPETPYEIAGAGLKIAYADDHALVLELRDP